MLTRAAVTRPGRRARPVLPPGMGVIAGNIGSSNCNGVPVPALAVISTSKLSVTYVTSEDRSSTFIA